MTTQSLFEEAEARGVLRVLWKLGENGTPEPATGIPDWGNKMGDCKRVIAWDCLYDDVRVSTIFTGIDYSFGVGNPLLWETMVFGGSSDRDQARYRTREEAMEGHRSFVDKLGPLPAVAGSRKWNKGDKVDATARGVTTKGEIMLVSENGRSLIVVCETDHRDILTPLLLKQNDDGGYATIFDGSPVIIKPRSP